MSSLHIHRWGPEPARVLLIHGITSSGATMWQLGEGLSDRGAIAPDLLGHGESPDADGYTLAALADGLGTGYELVIGHSLGGLVAAYAAVHDPGFAQRLILLDPALELLDEEFPAIRAGHRRRGHATRRRRSRSARTTPIGSPRPSARRRSRAARRALRRWTRILDDNAPWHHAHLLDRVTVPTLILAADPEVGCRRPARARGGPPARRVPSHPGRGPLGAPRPAGDGPAIRVMPVAKGEPLDPGRDARADPRHRVARVLREGHARRRRQRARRRGGRLEGHAVPPLRLQGGARRRLLAPPQRPRLRLAARGLAGLEPRDSVLALFDALGEWFREPAFNGCALVNGAIEARGAHQRPARSPPRTSTATSTSSAATGEELARQLLILVEGATTVAFVRNDPSAAKDAKAAARTAPRTGRAPPIGRAASRAGAAGPCQRAARVQPAGDDVDPVLEAHAHLEVDVRRAPGARRRRAVVDPQVPRLGVRELPLHDEGPGGRGALVDRTRDRAEQQLHRRRVARRRAVGRPDEARRAASPARTRRAPQRDISSGNTDGPGSDSSGSPAERSFCSKERAPSV